MPRRSGRYPWGSGKEPYQSAHGFKGQVEALRKQGMSQAQIAKAMGLTTTQLRAHITNANAELKADKVHRALELKQKGLSTSAIGREMGLNESSVRELLKPDALARKDKISKAADILREDADNRKYIDFGTGVELNLGVSNEQLKAAVEMLKEEGYETHDVYLKQAGTDRYTNIRVLTPPGVPKSEVVKNLDKIRTPGVVVNDGDITTGIRKPTNLDSKRLEVKYGPDGGSDMDGVIELRRGVPDLDLGRSSYAQVRVAVDGSHYLKGMAMYSDDLPKGVDVRFNTNKKNTGNKLDALKPLKSDPDNPFGATIRRQMEYTGKDGKKHLSPLNLVNDEGSWDSWSKSLASQFLSKQSLDMAKRQLGITRKKFEDDLQEIMSLTNPVIKRKLLEKFAENVDSASVHLKAAALPRQAAQVLLPLKNIKPNEIYAPNFKHGERVALVRYPHGGTFEIPELVVNNKFKDGKRLITPKAKDAVGIHPSVAERLSGADFDGDNAVVIPLGGTTKVKTTPTLRGLKGFDPKTAYPAVPGMKRMTNTQTEMGKISNLITDMTLHDAKPSEIARAVRHSMVVIDAEKHGLNYVQSEKDNGISQLKKKYQNGGGASTLISLAKSKAYVPERKLRRASEGGHIDPKTGELIYKETGRYYTKTLKNGTTKKVYYQTKTNKMSTVKNAHSLSSGTDMEALYAEHANKLKAMANKARLQSIRQPSLVKNPRASQEYAPEVKSLRAKLNTALRNKPLERQAQAVAKGVVDAKRASNPDIDDEEIAKLESMALKTARHRLGADKAGSRVTPTAKEWEAIQKGAVSNHFLEQIVDNADIEYIRQLATPRTQRGLTDSQAARAEAMSRNGATTAEIAEALGVSTSTVRRAINE
nr:MAG TPA: RNA dependent RNA polymerase [Caudoviricetes sp.]